MREIKCKLYYLNDNGTIVSRIVKFGEPIPLLGEQYGDPIGRGEYTGLKDKNDKEIYEGDIIIIKGYKDVIVEKGEVFWCDFSLRWKVDLYGFTRDNHIEIIGNIHQNPELLK